MGTWEDKQLKDKMHMVIANIIEDTAKRIVHAVDQRVKFMDAKRTAEYLGVTKQYVYSTLRHQLPVYRLKPGSTKIYFKLSELHDILEGNVEYPPGYARRI